VTDSTDNCKFLKIDKGPASELKILRADTTEHPSGIRVVDEPKRKFDRTAFVVMPFVEKGSTPRSIGFFTEVLKSLITPAGNGAGFAVETAAQREVTLFNQRSSISY
jgi:hypothetical protein